MPRLPSRKPADIVRLLKRNGFELARSKGSHHTYVRARDRRVTVVPMHAKDLPKGTLLDILKDAGLRKEDL